MSVEFDLAAAMAAAAMAPAVPFALPITALVTTQADVSLEGLKDVAVWIRPDSNTRKQVTLDYGDSAIENTVLVNVVVGRNLEKGDDEEVKAMHELTESILLAISSGVDSQDYDWLETDAVSLWDIDGPGKLLFWAERVMTFRAMSG